ncbi:MAG TPA: hypothetical protein VIN75_18165 [Burkholderiaceae bacterium]
MTQPVSRPPSAPDAEEPITEFVAHDPGVPAAPQSSIDLEIARSERASAALAATRALARAAFTDSQLAAEDAAAAAGIDAAEDAVDTEWVRTEYVALEQTLPPDDDARRHGAPRNLVGGSFNPGIASQQGRTFPGASMADASMKTRTGAQARFHHEARHAPRAEPAHAPTGHPARPVVSPSQAAAPSRARAPARAPARDGLRFLLAAGLGGVVVLAGGGLAWRAGLLSHGAASATTAATTPPAAVAAQAEAARVLSPAAPQEIPITPAAGPTPARSQEDTDAALAAAARAAAVPAASVRAAERARVAPPQAPAAVAPSAAITPAPAVHGKANVAAAIADAQAKADRFLSSNPGGTPTPAPAPTEGKPAP